MFTTCLLSCYALLLTSQQERRQGSQLQKAFDRCVKYIIPDMGPVRALAKPSPQA